MSSKISLKIIGVSHPKSFKVGWGYLPPPKIVKAPYCIDVSNHHKGPVDIFWVDTDGYEIFWNDMSNYHYKCFNYRAGNKWVFRDRVTGALVDTLTHARPGAKIRIGRHNPPKK